MREGCGSKAGLLEEMTASYLGMVGVGFGVHIRHGCWT
jgi:hypothetical protein